jgi:rhamnulokinase
VDQGALVRCVLESLALMYRRVLGLLEQLAGKRLDTVHIVGGGTQNRMLCQMTAEACNRHVLAGPVEATAIGNIMMQMVASGEVNSIADARAVIRDSFPVIEYLPADPATWDEAFGRFQQLPG